MSLESILNPMTIKQHLGTFNRFSSAVQQLHLPANQLAYYFATVEHETAYTFAPIKERGGKAYFIKRYWNNTKVREALGNRTAADAWRFCGKGYAQLTGYDNYFRFSIKLYGDNRLVITPSTAMRHTEALDILHLGFSKGFFTGKPLERYVNTTKTDFFNARRCINALDKAVTIAKRAEAFLKQIVEP